MDNYKLTAQGKRDLEDELQKLLGSRTEVSENIRVAREFGDLKENAEYAAAREEQERSEARIFEIENILKSSEIIPDPKNPNIVELGNTVSLDSKDGSKEFTIVGSVEADPLKGKISDISPIGQALLGKNLGDKVEIELPAGSVSYTIKKIS